MQAVVFDGPRKVRTYRAVAVTVVCDCAEDCVAVHQLPLSTKNVRLVRACSLQERL